MTGANRKRVCILTSSHNAKDDRAFHKEAVSLAKAGYDVVMVGRNSCAETFEGVRIVPLSESRSRFQRYIGHPLRCLAAGFRIRAAVYHFHDPELLMVGTLLRLAGKRVIYDVHDDFATELESKDIPAALRSALATAWRLFESVAGRFMTHVVTADSHVAKKFPPNRTTVLANFPPPSFGAATHDQRPDDGIFRVVYVGGVETRRGVSRVIDALDRTAVPGIQFHVAGPTDDADLLRRMEEHPKVTYHGVLPWSKVSSLLATADVGVVLLQPLPCYTYYPGENIIKLFEYMAMGLPVLISDFPKLKELIERVDAGMAVDPTSPEAIARAIEFLHQTPPVRLRMSENGRRAVRERFNWGCEEQKLLAIYQRLTASRD
jgi:glycosyltransferase involved in cell wall biosynthesis